ncbi:hypothetical protein K466DRAFT_499234 [Polyporus arcularius HHB13444]|uniref:DUF4218 domain-containing protein n=1 Tax=Polyporus arcularius HHB13444 TaxID=1314778 RepID=A0A5C3P1Y3_9APHY|nr:hypothetical protein K466DRAFT_499234 [Polyporus arcularius HHB13444]
MHNLFLGELRHHCREVWGIYIKDKAPTKKLTPHTPNEQQKWLKHIVAALRKKSLPSLEQPRKGYLVAVAQLNGIVPQAKLTKHEYAQAILRWTETHSVEALKIPPVLNKDTADFHIAANEYDISKRGILTFEVIAQLRSDIATTYLPSWIERPPVNFGSASHGKLKADHWRTVCTINMVITLVRLWSSSTATEGDRLLLENFTHLVIAVDLATRRSMDAERARLFDEHMLAYLQGLRKLFEHKLVPNHHLSLHLATCLMMFGPVHGWWGYPFERYNGIIQRLNTNNKIEEIPLTFMRLFCAAAELRWLIASTDWPATDEFRDMLEALNRAYQDAARGTRVVDVFTAIPGFSETSFDSMFNDLDDVRLDGCLYTQLVTLITRPNASSVLSFIRFDDDLNDPRPRLSPHVRHIGKLNMDRSLIYGTRSQNIRNSFVCFRNPTSEDPSLVRAGQISQIFLHRRVPEGQGKLVEPFVVVDEYVRLSPEHAAHDPYRRIPLLDTQLYYNRFHEPAVVLRPSDIICHFAAFVYTPEGIGEPCAVVRMLDRVRAS